MKTAQKTLDRATRHKRIRARITGTAARPRVALYRSNVALYAQFIDDAAGRTLIAGDTRSAQGTGTARATTLGSALATQAKKAGIEAVVIDRGGFRYAGAIAAFTDALRAGGINC